ncbi:unnamed protein product [Schistosoma mattheei]|uniref:Transmembrane protein n=1 Tax=Schistosoma mattheei TaxID=31246 RepID=A0A3P8KRE9_9TREM|nr:unnamed protein product [Schistosoma mattheei]
MPILVCTSSSEPPYSSMMLPRYAKDSTSSRVSPSRVIGLLFFVLYLRIIVLSMCMLRPIDSETDVFALKCRRLHNPVDHQKKEEGRE